MSPFDSAQLANDFSDLSEGEERLPTPAEHLVSEISIRRRKIEKELDEATSATMRVPSGLKLIPIEKRVVAPRPRFAPVKMWNCHVTEIDSDENTFVARIQEDVTDNEDDEVMVFDFDEINDDEVHLLKEGAVFLWFIGRWTLPSGQKCRGHQINFRRMPVHLDTDKKRALEEAKRIADGLCWEGASESA